MNAEFIRAENIRGRTGSAGPKELRGQSPLRSFHRLSLRFCFLVLLSALTAGSCKSAAPKRAFAGETLSYGMVYDHEGSPVNGAEILINGKKISESDIQGRFVLELKRSGNHRAGVFKEGYEPIEQSLAHDPMDILYIKMINASQLARLAENALDRQDYAGAEALLERALKLEPSRPDLLYLQSIVFYLEHDLPRSRAVLERLLARGIGGESVEALAALSAEGSIPPAP
ncbi:MAG: tetratricopeptide repeat protein [Treponema sp.]|jgi:tetratricopeptide (TPR) repeat protein|nr:tetratricopeptide repeat protein [Treponema sp.]